MNEIDLIRRYRYGQGQNARKLVHTTRPDTTAFALCGCRLTIACENTPLLGAATCRRCQHIERADYPPLTLTADMVPADRCVRLAPQPLESLVIDPAITGPLVFPYIVRVQGPVFSPGPATLRFDRLEVEDGHLQVHGDLEAQTLTTNGATYCSQRLRVAYLSARDVYVHDILESRGQADVHRLDTGGISCHRLTAHQIRCRSSLSATGGVRTTVGDLVCSGAFWVQGDCEVEARLQVLYDATLGHRLRAGEVRVNGSLRLLANLTHHVRGGCSCVFLYTAGDLRVDDALDVSSGDILVLQRLHCDKIRTRNLLCQPFTGLADRANPLTPAEVADYAAALERGVLLRAVPAYPPPPPVPADAPLRLGPRRLHGGKRYNATIPQGG